MSPARSLVTPAPSAIALGNFDGVHIGHCRLLDTLRTYAAERDLRPLALTFDPHPRHFFAPMAKAALLTPPREKAALVAAQGVELVTLPFDAALAALTAVEFYRTVLRGQLGGAAFFLGPDHRFGSGARGDAALLRTLAGADAVHEIQPVAKPPSVGARGGSPDDAPVSSSAIRALLESGRPADLDASARLLGRPYSLGGTVVRGRERGRLLGFPTANLHLEDARKALPAFGVYGGYARVDGKVLPAVANIGMRPTFSEPEPAAEIHLLDFEGDLYGKFLEFELAYPIRPEMKFASVENLQAQIAADIRLWKSRLALAK